MPRPCPDSDATFHAIDWSPRDILLPYVLLAVLVRRAAHGYLIEEYLTQQWCKAHAAACALLSQSHRETFKETHDDVRGFAAHGYPIMHDGVCRG
jgi:hypothetical protein